MKTKTLVMFIIIACGIINTKAQNVSKTEKSWEHALETYGQKEIFCHLLESLLMRSDSGFVSCNNQIIYDTDYIFCLRELNQSLDTAVAMLSYYQKNFDDTIKGSEQIKGLPKGGNEAKIKLIGGISSRFTKEKIKRCNDLLVTLQKSAETLIEKLKKAEDMGKEIITFNCNRARYITYWNGEIVDGGK